MFNSSFSFLNVCFSSFFNVLNVEGSTFSDFLNLLKSVILMFLEYFVKFCDVLLDNWFILVIVGFGLFVSVILIAFDFIDLSFLSFGIAKGNIDDYLDKKSDLKNKIRLDAEKELINRQNITQRFNFKTNNIEDIYEFYDEPEKVLASPEEQKEMQDLLRSVSDD